MREGFMDVEREEILPGKKQGEGCCGTKKSAGTRNMREGFMDVEREEILPGKKQGEGCCGT